MEDDQEFCLRWNNHQSTIVSTFENLLKTESLVDCTLAAEGRFLKAHKIVLSACSPYFAALLLQQYDKHPIFILKDVKYLDLCAIMDYMYRGEVNISHDQLNDMLQTAKSLQIKGLSDNRGEGNGDAAQQESEEKKQPVQSRHSTGTTVENKRPRTMDYEPSDLVSKRKKVNQRRKTLAVEKNIESTLSQDKVKEQVNSTELPSTFPNNPIQKKTTQELTEKVKEKPKRLRSSNKSKQSQPKDNEKIQNELNEELEQAAASNDGEASGEPSTSNLSITKIAGLTWEQWNERLAMPLVTTLREDVHPFPQDHFLNSIKLERVVATEQNAMSDSSSVDSNNPSDSPSNTGTRVETQPESGVSCPDCGRTYKLKSSLRNHQKWECGKEPQFTCPFCTYRAKQKMHIGRHMERMHKDKMYKFSDDGKIVIGGDNANDSNGHNETI